MDTGGWNYVGVVWRRWENVWVTLLALTLTTLPACQCQEYIARGCPGGQEDSPPVDVDLSCPEGQVISLGEAKFGRNKYTHCTITDGDCLDKTDAFIGCEGRQNCTVHFDKPYSPSCGYASFITVTYDCQTVTSTPPPIVQLPSSTPHVSHPVSFVTTRATTVQSDTGRGQTQKSGDDNAALIAGCVVAVIVTVVLLIIAIIMVVRRLACSELSEDEEKKSTSCFILPCVRTGQNENDPKPRQEEAGSHDSGGSEDKKCSKRKRNHRGRWADKNQNMSPRLAPVGQEDEGGSSASQSRATASARASVYGEAGVAGGSSARSSLAMETNAQVKRHSSGAKSAGSDISKEQGRGGGEIPELDEFNRGGGEEGKGSWRGPQGRGGGSFSGSGKMTTTGFSAPNPQRASSNRKQKSSADKAAKCSKPVAFDAVAVPNTETFTAC
ncbi:uncharacterized protein LOC143282938 isoform X2 [Babylonia areolata]|uniref:uncharacterized protein LOC143282938 isoform X2 n=1 Tax=Babylonia areolata TaxID=304850 RepID=UPI003FD59008